MTIASSAHIAARLRAARLLLKRPAEYQYAVENSQWFHAFRCGHRSAKIAALIVCVCFSNTTLAQQNSGNGDRWTNAFLSGSSKDWVAPTISTGRKFTPSDIPTISVSSPDNAADAVEPTLPVDDLSTDTVLPLPAIDLELKRRQEEREDGYRRLRQQLQELMSRMEQVGGDGSGCDPAQPPSQRSQAEPPNDATALPETPSVPEIRPGQGTTAEENPELDTPEDSHLKAVPPELPVIKPPIELTPPTTNDTSVFLESLKAAAIVDGPVDRIGLADNLYAMNETKIALEMYEKVDVKALPPSERYWVAYQRASCHRRLGQIPEAQELYRRLAGQQSAGWLAQTSRWWLDQIDTRQSLKEKLDTYDQVLQKFRQLYPEETATAESLDVQPQQQGI